eukprot:1139715-Pelagomonas_calceolata.AAC.2
MPCVQQAKKSGPHPCMPCVQQAKNLALIRACLACNRQKIWLSFVHALRATGLHLHLDSLRIHKSNVLGKGPEYVGNTLVDPTAKIGTGCLIGGLCQLLLITVVPAELQVGGAGCLIGGWCQLREE